MKHPVLLWTDEPAAYVRAASEAGLDASFDFASTPLTSDVPDDLLGGAEVLLAWRAPRALADRAPKLRWIQSLTGGVEHWLASPHLPRGVTLTCARGTHRLQMPEHILAALFMVTKQIPGIVLDQRERRWRRRVNPTLAGQTLGILGLGAVGGEVARKAHALDLRVIGTRREPKPMHGVDRVYGPDGTDRVLAESDFVVLLLPSTALTRRSIDATALARMKPTAYLFNFGRGDLVVERDLVEAVQAGTIAGAVLDVFPVEPLPADSPLWSTDGIVVFPHVGGLHPARDRFVAELFVENLRRFGRGEPLLQVVDRDRGY